MKNLLYASLVTLCFYSSLKPSKALFCKTTSYAPQEDGNFRSCTGARLQRGDCAADLRFYPLGTKILLNGQIYRVADCGGLVRGRYHFDIFCPTIKEMHERGTVFGEVCIQRLPVRGGHKQVVANQHSVQSLSRAARTCVYSSKRVYGRALQRLDDSDLLCTL